jgi:hypothetical protein
MRKHRLNSSPSISGSSSESIPKTSNYAWSWATTYCAEHSHWSMSGNRGEVGGSGTANASLSQLNKQKEKLTA